MKSVLFFLISQLFISYLSVIYQLFISYLNIFQQSLIYVNVVIISSVK